MGRAILKDPGLSQELSLANQASNGVTPFASKIRHLIPSRGTGFQASAQLSFVPLASSLIEIFISLTPRMIPSQSTLISPLRASEEGSSPRRYYKNIIRLCHAGGSTRLTPSSIVDWEQ